jgi:hypothetical protein
MHMESVSLRGWASTGYRAIQPSHHVPFYLLPPNHHHLPDALRHSNESQVTRGFLMAMILRGTPWPLQGHRGPICCRRKWKMNINNWNSATTTLIRYWLRAHLFALTMASLKIGCQVKSFLRRPLRSHLFLLPCSCRHQRRLDQQPSPFRLGIISNLHR